MQKIFEKILEKSSSLKDLSLLIVRLILAYGFYEPAMNKIKNFNAIVGWFGESLNLPFPYLNAVMATATEVAGVVLIALGLMTRIISIPMMVVMVVAIKTVHWTNGFPASENGIEIPLYYMIMLFVLFTHGPGKFSLDETIFKKFWTKD